MLALKIFWPFKIGKRVPWVCLWLCPTIFLSKSKNAIELLFFDEIQLMNSKLNHSLYGKKVDSVNPSNIYINTKNRYKILTILFIWAKAKVLNILFLSLKVYKILTITSNHRDHPHNFCFWKTKPLTDHLKLTTAIGSIFPTFYNTSHPKRSRESSYHLTTNTL